MGDIGGRGRTRGDTPRPGRGGGTCGGYSRSRGRVLAPIGRRPLIDVRGGGASAARARGGGGALPGCRDALLLLLQVPGGKDVVVELKNDLSICGTLHSVDQYLNIKLTDISVTDPEKYPHMLSVKNCFIRGSVVRYVQLPADEVDTQLLQDAARKEALQQKQ
ncbi:U6 snRNA-associated Sm-like protein LSm2 [Colius striatus]|uniref:U6 snRNA-associated Sm-like protein LSm2 n=1 Tax=Colius striatus TaxID=57412 RepID=UPI002B1E2841|nr:U6 snRNA-associated Sm-like protein LSm2 [Colius striatus]